MLQRSFITTLLSACLLFSACSDDDTNNTTPGNSTPPSGQQNPPSGQQNPPSGQQDPIKPAIDAIQFNEGRLLPIRFILKLKRTLQSDIDNSSLAKAVKFDQATVDKIAQLQEQWFGTSRNGFIDAETQLRIEAELFHEADMAALIGTYTAADKVLIDGIQDKVDESVYNRARAMIEDFGGYFDETPGIRNMLAIRGATIDNGKIKRTSTARLYQNYIDDPSTDSKNTVHFASGMALHPDSGEPPFDDTMLVIWKETDGGNTHYNVKAFPLNVDPGMQGGNENGYAFDGTAHLKDGQYIGIINRHSTGVANHARAVLQACYEDTNAYDMLAPAANKGGNYTTIPWEDLQDWINKESLPRIQYNAINNIYNSHQYNGEQFAASGTTEVIRDFHIHGEPSDGVLTAQEVQLARKVLANSHPEDAILSAIYPSLSLNEALKTWIEQYFIQYTEDECQWLFDMPASVVYADYYASSRGGQFALATIRYLDTDRDIAINIHTSPNTETSSQGCLNIPIMYYTQFIASLADATKQTNYLYTLVDASKIKALDDD